MDSQGMSIVGIANPDLKWERTKWNIGLDLSFIDRISVTLFDYYQRKTSDLIYMTSPYHGGYYDGYQVYHPAKHRFTEELRF